MGRSLTDEEEKKLIANIQNGRFIYNYKFKKLIKNQNRTFLNITCTKCNNTFDVPRDTFLRHTKEKDNGGCKYCSKRKKTDNEIHDKIKLLEKEYEFITDKNIITTLNQEIIVKHKKCDYEFKSKLKKLDDFPCKRCSNLENTSKKIVEEYINKNNLEYELLDYMNAKNVHDDILLCHTSEKCFHRYEPFKMTINNFKNKEQRCPFCKMSKGEDNILLYLKNNKKSYIRSYKEPTCKNKRLLPFDIKTDNNIIIEFDGEQHFIEDHYYNRNKFMYRKTCDQIKNEWCKENNYKLLRIGYYDINYIDQILDDLFNDNINLNSVYSNIYYYDPENKKLIESGLYTNFYTTDTNIIPYLDDEDEFLEEEE